MTEKPSLWRYFKGEFIWAAKTSKEWMGVLFRSPKLAFAQLKAGARSGEFRERAGYWNLATTFTYRETKIRLPLMVGVVAFLFAVFGQVSIFAALGYGVLAGVFTYLALFALPFVALLAVPALAVFLIRAVLPADVPSAPKEGQSVAAAEKANESGGEGTPGAQPPAADPVEVLGDDILSGEARMEPNGALLKQFEGRDQPFFLRLLESDGAVTISDKEDVETVERWIVSVRGSEKELESLKEVSARFGDLTGFIGRKVLMEMGLLDKPTFDSSPQRVHVNEFDRIEAAVSLKNTGWQYGVEEVHFDANGNHGVYSSKANGEPVLREDAVKLISPRGNGYLLVEPHVLEDMESPRLTCDAVRDLVVEHVRNTGNKELMQAFLYLKRTSPHVDLFAAEDYSWSPAGQTTRLDLLEIEEDLLAGQVTDKTARKLATYYAALEEAKRGYEDYIAHQRRVLRFAKHVIETAHGEVRLQAQREREVRVAARSGARRELYGSQGISETVDKTRAARRAELHGLLRNAVPKSKGEW